MMHSPLSPHIRKPASIQNVMLTVLIALLPGIAAHVWIVGAGILFNLLLASVVALAAEATVLRLRGRPVGLHLADLSALVTAWLVVMSLPPIVPWWLTVLATLVAVVVAKHLYGGLGQNPFNPAMVAYCVSIVAYPALMSQWPEPGKLDLTTQMNLILGGERVLDAITGATPLDSLRTALRTAGANVAEILSGSDFGLFGGSGWEWIALAYLLGGLLLLARRIITWHMPVAFLGTLTLLTTVFWLIDPARHAPPTFHLASGGAMLAAFFIITDPVSAASTPRGKLIFAAGVALIAWLIRNFGAYPEGIAFAVLLMNICVPLIDMKTQPPVFGQKGKNA